MPEEVVVVTGASSGVGRAVARAFGRRGARVGLVARVWAARQAPREILVGWPTVQAVWGQKVIPGLLDRYLARRAWDAQFVDAPNAQDGRDILFATLPGDPGAHGPYRERERGPDLQMRLRARPKAVVAGLAALGGLALLAPR